ncbi:FAD-dependent monooxygenase [Sphingomonas colocasiae]|uniref:FAD-dependent monooxygenase n=1 Tax=Sphingomonas colocasiae TaxID=1848973 RepID=A0ABS7PSS2_9SPHN|nr:FAD-dependent monooxygenase [Sphingomonas colocasiae]MBY8824338.1 FAD-dependent monooxygenase [Sphingomonas colocasiae]
MGFDGEFDVIVAGAGPVGLSMTIDLGRRGVRTMIMERDITTAPWPKMDRSNARTMELYRRLGLADRIRALGYPADNPMDVILTRTMNEAPIAVIPFPSVAERRRKIAECTDGSLPLEPYQLVSQNHIEPLLRQVAEHETPNTSVRYGLELVDLEQDADGVTVTALTADGTQQRYRCRYLVGTDGGSSTVRKRLDVKLEGRPALFEMRQVIFWSEDLYERMKAGKGRHYSLTSGGGFVAQGDRKEFTFHTMLPADTDFEPVLRKKIGFDCDLTIRHITSWRPHLLLAERYREGRVLMAGDAVHLVIPTGGLGMNTGVGDAFDLSWKLAGMIQGWGGEGLIESYEIERRPVAQRNIEASGWAADGSALWLPHLTPEIDLDGPDGDAARSRLAEAFKRDHGRMHGMVGAETCYTYAGSPLVAHEPGNQAHWEISRIVPHARPGIRIPHMWLKDGRPLHDLIGNDFTLLDLRGDFDASGLETAFAAIGAPFEIVRLDEPHLIGVFNAPAFLLRPDLHVAWRGDAPPADAQALARMATGHGPGFRR